MRTVKVNKTQLLEKVRENRVLHAEAYQKAIRGYYEKSIVELRKMLDLAESRKNFSSYTGLTRPEPHLADYDRIIAMLEMSVESHIELQQDEFTRYVQDSWDWKQHFTATTAFYNN